MKFFARLLFAAGLTLPVSAMAQSVGTVSLPSGAGVLSSTLLAAAINQALTAKLDAGAAAIATALGYTPASTVSPAFTGTPTAPTAAPGTNTTQIATTAFTTAAISASPGAVTSVVGQTGAVTASQIATATQGTSSTTLAAGNDSRITGACQTSGCTFTGGITPKTTNGIVGTTAGDNANAGSDGESIQASTTATSVSMTSATVTNITQVTLTPGDWNVSGVVSLNCSGSVGITNGYGGVTTTSAATPPFGQYAQIASTEVSSVGFLSLVLTTPIVRFNVSSTTLVYLTGFQTCTSGTLTGGGTILARRIR
jgi:hypothetical protein